MKLFKILFFVLLFTNGLYAQKYFTRSGTITFTSEAPLEKIEAVNQKATSIMDIASGKMEFAVLIKAFQFEKALMQEHFNENYLESDKYPKAIFKGQIDNISSVDFSKDGTYPVKVSGDLTIHGVTKPVQSTGTLSIKDGKINGASTFEVAVADYEIKIPNIVKDNIAKTVEIIVAVDYELFEKNS
jgi:hypothetical protein